jgi:hypothetical protein
MRSAMTHQVPIFKTDEDNEVLSLFQAYLTRIHGVTWKNDSVLLTNLNR